MKRYVMMMTLLLLSFVLAASPAAAIEGFRGSTWGEARQELPQSGDSNLLLQGWIRQGVDWAKWGNLTLNTYATLRYEVDTRGYDYNNSVGPGLGVSLEAYSPKGATGSLGVEYIWDRYTTFDESAQKVVVYANWYGWWDLKKK
jgi:hypothetical protein